MAGEAWRENTIGQLLAADGGSIKTGPFGTTLKASEYSSEGVPLISVREVGYGLLSIDESTPRVPLAVTNRLPEYLLRPGDIVFGRKGTVDRSAHIKEQQDGWFLGSDGIRLRLPKTCDSRFIAYQLQSMASRIWLIQHSTGTTMASLNQGVIERIPIVLPPLSEQRAIAHILGTLDDKINLNRQLNETLEAAARALFQSWFVDFDPVRAKAQGRNPGLPNAITDLFPERFEDSDLGEIPVGWEVRGLNEIARFLNGLALQKFPPKDGRALPVIKIAQLRAGTTDGADGANADLASDYVVEDGDVLFSWSGSLECVLWAGGRGALNQHLFKVTSSKYPKWFYYLWIRHHLPEFQQVAAAKATTMGHIQRHHLSEAKVLLPPLAVLKAADEHIGTLVDAILKRRVESRTLTTIRDALLPMLISGDIRLGEPDRIVRESP